jgi:hypothetical protein
MLYRSRYGNGLICQPTPICRMCCGGSAPHDKSDPFSPSAKQETWHGRTNHLFAFRNLLVRLRDARGAGQHRDRESGRNRLGSRLCGEPFLLAGAKVILDVSVWPAATAIHRAQFHDAFANQHAPTTPHSFLEQGRIIDWLFMGGPIRASQAEVHRSVSTSDHYPLSICLALG